ncbi:maleylpyruvate isomerase N-terminal domain-containing protein [Streptomyces sp. NA04227]|uniref:maleylpyruvate isomerase N-terminal domain-containing protein n=1 Tax=Streptomyces sp. NA04227 TaxID=2742136 RepID=UPI0015925CA2|nr:maleylpyruvate isomerase N-terminal domain-containing protein [Streptomyces sp. NA04227]QKW05684.1 maleylpyruvate isomerase N-terminal domain-containing protein [Streptomyces sp. NA04227]
MESNRVLDAFRGEARDLTRAVEGLSEAQWDLPTRCQPWSVRELLGHVRMTVARVPSMLDAPAPPRAEVSAAEYYRPDDRFSPQANTARIATARDQATGHADGAALVRDFVAVWQRTDRLCRAEPVDRVVRTRHGDPMLLTQFLVTRVVEVAVHGLDLAAALDREPWLTAPAADVVLELMLASDRQTATRELGWDRAELLRRITGREPLDPAAAAQVERLGIRWLTLG